MHLHSNGAHALARWCNRWVTATKRAVIELWLTCKWCVELHVDCVMCSASHNYDAFFFSIFHIEIGNWNAARVWNLWMVWKKREQKKKKEGRNSASDELISHNRLHTRKFSHACDLYAFACVNWKKRTNIDEIESITDHTSDCVLRTKSLCPNRIHRCVCTCRGFISLRRNHLLNCSAM